MPWSEPISAGERETLKLLREIKGGLERIEAKLEPKTLGDTWVEVSTVKERAEGQRRFVRSD